MHTICFFFLDHSQFTGQQEKGETPSLTPLFDFYRLHRHRLEPDGSSISQKYTVESERLKIFSITSLRGCSYENSFPVVFWLSREKDIISSRSYTNYFPVWARFIMASCSVGKLWEKPLFKMGRLGYSISKRLVRLTRFKSFPLQLSGHQDIPLL